MSVDPLRSGLIFSFRPLDSSTIHPSSSIPVRNLNLQTPGFSKDGVRSVPQSTNHPMNAEKTAESSVKDIFEKLYRATPLPAILTGKTPTSNNVRTNQTHLAQASVPQSQSHYLHSVTKRIDYGGEVVRESPQQPYLTPAVMLPPPFPSRPPQSAPISLQSSTSTPMVAVRPTVAEQPILAPQPRATTSECSVQTMPTIPEESEESPPVSPVKKPSAKNVQVSSLPPSSPQAPKTITGPTPVSLSTQSNIVVASPPVESTRPSNDLVTNIYQQVMAKLAQDVAQHLISPRIVSTLVEQQLSAKVPNTDLLPQLDEQTDPIDTILPFDEQPIDPEPEEPKQAPAPSPVRKKKTSKPPLPPTSSLSTPVATDRRTRTTQQKAASSLLIAADPLPVPTKSSESITSQSEEESNAKVIKKKKVIPKTIVSNSLLGIAAEEQNKPEIASSSSSQLGKRSREMPANSLLAIASSSIKSEEEDSENTESNFVEERKQGVENQRKRRMEFSSALLSTLIEPVKSSPVKPKPHAVFVTSSLTAVDSPLPVKAKKTEKIHSPVPTSSSSSEEEEEEEEIVKRSKGRQRSPVNKEAPKQAKEVNNSLPQRTSRPIKKAIVSSGTSSSSSEKEINEKEHEEQEEEIVQYSSPQRGHQQKEIQQNKKSTKQPKKKDDVNTSPTKVKEIKQRANEFVQMKESLLLLSQQTASPSPKKASVGSVSSSLLQTTDAGPWRQHELIALYAAHGKTDVRKANFWEIISQKLHEGGINRSKEECEQQWFRHLQQTEERKANNLKKKKESQTTKAMEKFDSLLQQNTNNTKSNAVGKKRKSSKKAKEEEEEEVEEEQEQEEMEVVKEVEEDEQDKQARKKPRILKKDLELIAQQSALATKHDDIFESEKFKKQLQAGHRTSFTSNLLHNISTSISSPKMSSPVAITRTRGRRYSQKNVGKGRKKDKDDDEDEEEEEEEDNSEKEEIPSKSKTMKGRGSSVITTSSTRHVRGYGAEEEEESLFKKQHIQKINKTRIKPQLLVSYSNTENNSSQSSSNHGKSAQQKGGKGGSVAARGGVMGLSGSSSLLSSLYPQDKLSNRLEQRDYVKQQNDEFNQKLKKSFQQMNKLKKREEEENEEDSEEESIGEEDSNDLESDED